MPSQTADLHVGVRGRPIRCDACGEAFLPEDTDRDEYNAANPPPTTGPSEVDTDTDEGDDMVFYDPTGARRPPDR
jgi:hypothetical protein